MAIRYSLVRKKPFLGREKAEGKFYAVAQHDGVLRTEEFTKTVCNMYHSLDPTIVQSVLTAATECLRKQLLNGKRVRMEPLGDFYMVINGTGSENTANFARSNIKDVRVKWVPGKPLRNLMSKAKFHLADPRRVQAEAKRLNKLHVQEELDEARRCAEAQGETQEGE